MSVTFDGTELISATYMPRFVKHESAAERALITHPLAREDGSILINERYGSKSITLQGAIRGSSQSDLESKIDTFLELFSRPEKNLDIDWAGGTRRYVATCMRHTFDRDHYHLSVVPWTAEFVVLSGEGKDTATTTAVNAETVATSVEGVGTTSVTFAGSKPPKPTVLIANIDAGSAVRGIEYKNTGTGERLVVTYPGAWGDNRSVTVNMDARTVTGDPVDGVTKDLDFFGAFPAFAIGANNIQITVGGIVNQKSADDALADLNASLEIMSATTRQYAQSFMVPYTDGTFQGVQLAIKKTGTPGNITWRVETDNGGKPSGSLASADATGVIGSSDATTSTSFVTDFSSNPFMLAADTVYWLVLQGGATLDASNKWEFGTAGDATYARGYAKISEDTGATWANFGTKKDLSFRILHGGTPATLALAHTVTYTKTYL